MKRYNAGVRNSKPIMKENEKGAWVKFDDLPKTMCGHCRHDVDEEPFHAICRECYQSQMALRDERAMQARRTTALCFQIITLLNPELAKGLKDAATQALP